MEPSRLRVSWLVAGLPSDPIWSKQRGLIGVIRKAIETSEISMENMLWKWFSKMQTPSGEPRYVFLYPPTGIIIYYNY